MEDQEKATDESLDFLSPNFDPLKALTSSPSIVQVPCPDVQPCDNLRMYEAVLSGRRRMYAAPKEDEPSPPAPVISAPAQPMPQPQEPKFYSKSVIAFMKRENLGPFKLLQDCWKSHLCVRVWIRHCVGVRGVCQGVPLAFDKHMNLVLGEVTEYFQPFRTLGNGGLDSTSRQRKRKKKKAKESDHVTQTIDHVTETTDHVTKTDGHVTQIGHDETVTTAGHVTQMSQETVTPASHVTKAGDHVTKGCCHMINNLDSFRTRHLSRLFIRGDNVVLIAPIR